MGGKMAEKLTRDKAKTLFAKYLKTENLVKHSIETEAVMKALAKHFGEDEEFWGACGLLHDLDLDTIGTDMSKHAVTTVELLKSEGLDEPLLFSAVLAHAEKLNSAGKRESKLDYALSAGENITGLIFAYALILPSKKLADVKPSSVMKRLKEKAFAAKVDRELIADIEKAGLAKEKFVEIAVEAMKSIADQIGL
jgi:uncharacterized protein